MPLAPGRLIGAYEILELLGQGGMGEVYRARDTRLGRMVAIKIVSSDLETDPAATDRLRREAQLASSLNHSSIVTVHDVGQFDGRPFIVMELVDGASLSVRLARGAMPVREALDMACEVSDGLAAAHGAGVVHRDLKPANIMLTADHRAKIVDFGLSKTAPAPRAPDDETEAQPDLTAAHTLLGSVGYMAPEQVSRSAVTFRADQFALGVVLYEALTGRRAFKRDTAIQTMAAIIGEEPTAVTEYCPAVPPQLATILARCLSKRPGDRYASTHDLARDLRDARHAMAGGERSHVSSAMPARRRGSRVAAVMLAATVIVAVSFATWKASHRSSAVPVAFRQVAVLPFTCRPAATDEIYCAGVVETLTSGLSALQRFDPAWRVVPQAVVIRDLPADKTNADNAKTMLGATVVLSGQLERSAGRTRVTLQVTEGAAVHSTSFDIAADQEVTLPRTLVSSAAELLGLRLSASGRSAIVDGATTVPRAGAAYLLGRGYLHSGNADAAITALTSAVQADPSFALAHAALCDAYAAASQPDLARASCTKALEIDSRLAPVHVSIAAIARRQGRREAAIQSAKRAVELDKWSAETYHELGAAYEADEQWSAAEATYNAALAARPDDSQISSDLCRFYALTKRWDLAETRCAHARQLTPDNTRVLNNLGAALIELQRSDEAAAVYRRSFSIRANSTAAAMQGLYAYGQGNYADAARWYETAAGLKPARPLEIYRSLGASLYWTQTGEARAKAASAYAEVVRLTEQALAASPRDPLLLGQLADAYSLIGKLPKARETLDTLERLSPDAADKDVLFLVASVHEQLHDREPALAWLKRALAAGYSRDQVSRSPFLADLTKDDRYARLVAK